VKITLTVLALCCLLASAMSPAALPQPVNTDPPAEPVRLIFIHHSTGGNWLADPNQNELGGDLGRALMENNYYVSATNYGWGPDSIGDATDIPNWVDWFRGERSSVYLDALYNEGGQNFVDFGSWPRLVDAPAGENRIIVFKSCFPNSELEGRPDDPAAALRPAGDRRARTHNRLHHPRPGVHADSRLIRRLCRRRNRLAHFGQLLAESLVIRGLL